MDILENLFGRATNWLKKKNRSEKLAFQVLYDDHYSLLSALVQGTLTVDSAMLQPSSLKLPVVYPDCVYLPSEIDFFPDFEFNKKILMHQALAAGAVLDLKFGYSSDKLPVFDSCVEIVRMIPKIQKRITEAFPSFPDWAEDLYSEHLRFLSAQSIPERDLICLEMIKRVTEADSSDVESSELVFPSSWQKEFNCFPFLALAPWSELLRSSQSENFSMNLDPKAQDRKDRSEKSTEKKGKKNPKTERIDLNEQEKKENPVTHSFEKLETADEYTGGYRKVDGDDDLSSHENALDELDLNKVTRDGGEAKSVYRSEVYSSGAPSAQSLQNPVVAKFKYYPEWNYQSKKLLENHCRLYLSRGQTSDSESAAEAASLISDKLIYDVLERHGGELKRWQDKLVSLVNARKWIDRQWDGSEISIDHFVRYLSDVKTGVSDPRVYLQARPKVRDFASLILLDQSLSTDSWVLNRRVLDVEIESLILCSELLKNLNEPIAVASTYSATRSHCQFVLYKDFHDPWSQSLGKITQISPKGYTRLGPAIRHSIDLLSKTGARQKVLILLTDGKPTDYDRYEGRYGIEDIRHATFQAAQQGVSLRALAIESEAKNYFPFLFGPQQFNILTDPSQLPESLFKIYFDLLVI